MINLTLEQAKLALDIIENDISVSQDSIEYSGYDFSDVDHLQYCLNRAVLAERLQNAINANEKG